MSVDTLIKALHGLQTDHLNREEYNQWLQTFQRSAEAWQVTYDVLSDVPKYSREIKIFCAQTLRHKISRDLYQVPKPDQLGLKDKVIHLLELNVDLVSVVGVQLCVALASLAMQVHEWDHVLEEMITRLSAPHFIPLLFEFLKVLPEEFSSSRASFMDPNLSQVRAKELIGDNAYKVISFMVERAQFLQNGPEKVLFFETLNPWLIEVEAVQVVQSPILDWIFSALQGEETIEPAADCLTTLLDEANDVREPSIQPAIEVLYRRLIELRPVYAQYPEHTELHRHMTRVFARAGENWHILLAEQPEIFSPLLEAIVDCVLVPDADLDIIEYTFKFFDDLMLVLETRNMDGPQRRFESAIVLYQPLFRQLLTAFTRFLEYPSGHVKDLFNGDREEEDKFRDFRYEIGDMIKICSFILGSDSALTICADRLEELLAAPETSTWQQLESVLFCIRALARDVPDDNEILPRVFHIFPRLPNHEKVYHAALLILGRYSMWASKHEDYIEFELNYILRGIQSEHNDVRRAAAHALMYFCTDCARQMTTYTPQLVEFYSQVSGHLDLESFCKVGDGIGHIMHELDTGDLTPALEAIYLPVMQRAQALVHAGPGAPVLEQDRVGEDVHALGSFVATVRTSGEADDASPLTLLIKRNHEIIVSLLVTFGAGNAKIAEGVARYYIYAVHNSGRALIPELSTLLTATAQVTKTSLYPFMYELGGSFAQCYNDQQFSLVDANTIDMIWQFSQVQTSAFLDHFEAASSPDKVNHELLENGFHYLCDFIVYYTPQFVFSDSFDRSIRDAVKTLSLDDTGVLVSVANYLEDIATLIPAENTNSQFDETLQEAIFTKVSSIIRSSGADIVYQVFYGYIYNYDADFEPKADSMLDFVFKLGSLEAIPWIQSAFDSLPAGSVSEEEKVQVIQRIFNLMAANRFSGLGAIIKSYAKAYVERNILPR